VSVLDVSATQRSKNTIKAPWFLAVYPTIVIVLRIGELYMTAFSLYFVWPNY